MGVGLLQGGVDWVDVCNVMADNSHLGVLSVMVGCDCECTVNEGTYFHHIQFDVASFVVVASEKSLLLWLCLPVSCC